MSISPNVPSPQESYHYESSGTPRWISVLFGLLFVALAAIGVFAYTSTSKLTKDLGDAQKTNATLSTQLEQANTRIAELKSIVEVTQQKVGMTAAEVASAKSRAESIRKEQIAADQKLSSQLTDDLEDLKRRGERNYYEFNLKKAKNAQRVGPIQINVSKTDPKKSKYTILVFADDKQIEKKDKTSGEPVQFYVGQSRAMPYEIVVFNVGKDQITGYLSTPKDAGSAPAAAAPAKP